MILKSFQLDTKMEQDIINGVPGMVTSSMTVHCQIHGSPIELEQLSSGPGGPEFIGRLASALGVSSSDRSRRDGVEIETRPRFSSDDAPGDAGTFVRTDTWTPIGNNTEIRMVPDAEV